MATASRSSAEPPATEARSVRPWRSLGLWLLLLAVCTALLGRFEDRLHETHKALAYLLIVLAGSARNGRVVGLTLAVGSFLAFNFFLVEPRYSLTIADPLDWWVLASFLVTGGVAAELFHRAQRARALAERRAREIDRLAALGAESLSVPDAGEAVEALTRVILGELPVRSARVLAVDGEGARASALLPASPRDGDEPDGRLVEKAAWEGRIVTVGLDGTFRTAEPDADMTTLRERLEGCSEVFVPLQVRDRTVGVLHLAEPEGLGMEPAQAAFADALTHYAALALERARLAGEAEHVAALREADRLKDALIASVSHDLRTPLTTIRALAAELRTEGDDRTTIIEEEAERLNRFVSDLLDLSRARAGALPLEAEVVAAEDLVGAALQRLGGVGAERIDVDLPSDGTLPLGRFDFVQALRALANLLENALRHSPDTARVDLEVREEGDELVLRVMDRGSGVPEGERGRLFEPFFRSATSPAAGGTGLGLAIARRVTEAQGGSVRYLPRQAGGSVFELRFPGEALEDLT